MVLKMGNVKTTEVVRRKKVVLQPAGALPSATAASVARGTFCLKKERVGKGPSLRPAAALRGSGKGLSCGTGSCKAAKNSFASLAITAGSGSWRIAVDQSNPSAGANDRPRSL